MTEKEEIREGVYKICSSYPNEVGRQVSINEKKLPGSPLDVEAIQELAALEVAHNVMKYLNSRGVVIKVDRELPIVTIDPTDDFLITFKQAHEIAKVYQQEMLKAGFTAVEPLVWRNY